MLTFLINVLILVISSVTLFFSLQVITVFLKKIIGKKITRYTNPTPAAMQAACGILIPAHNEQDVIAATLQSIKTQVRPQDEIIVVADNCNDSTVNISKKYGATVLARFDHERKGKGYALAYGMEYIEKQNFDAVIIIDADCILAENSRDALVSETLEKQVPIQALYLMRRSGGDHGVGKKIAEFAWLIKNKIRPEGLQLFGGPCQLMGTGMAFPASKISSSQLATGCVVEDMKMGLDYTIQGFAPQFLSAAKVTSVFPSDEATSDGQRSRWIHGHLEMILAYSPKLLLTAVCKRDKDALLMMLDLTVLPLVLLLLVNIVAIVVFGISSLFVEVWFCLMIVSFTVFLLALLLCWLMEGRQVISFFQLLIGVLSILKKFGIYSRFLTKRCKEWNKTARK